MSIRSLADFMEVSPRSVRRLASTATVTGRGDPHVDASARGADFSWPKTGTSRGHQCGLFMAISADFLVATDIISSYNLDQAHSRLATRFENHDQPASIDPVAL